jgi:hypothetical protein
VDAFKLSETATSTSFFPLVVDIDISPDSTRWYHVDSVVSHSVSSADASFSLKVSMP